MYRRMYCCGGGMVSVTHMGVLQELEAQGYLSFIKEWIGVSSGGLLALIMATGYTVKQGLEILKMDFQEVTEPDAAPGWLLNFGYDTGNKLLRFVQALLKERGLKESITFRELFEATGYSFRTFATDMNEAALVEFSKGATPDYPVAYALRASMSLPYYFQPFKCPLTGILYIDGAAVSNFPLHRLTEEERSETLAVAIPYRPLPNSSIELQEFLMRPLQILIGARSQFDSQRYPYQTIVVTGITAHPTNFGMSMEEKIAMVAKGREAARTFLLAQRPVRRYSVS